MKKSTSQVTSLRERSARAMVLFVFFMLTIGASSGLLHSTKSASIQQSHTDQLAATVAADDADTSAQPAYIPGVLEEALHTENGLVVTVTDTLDKRRVMIYKVENGRNVYSFAEIKEENGETVIDISDNYSDTDPKVIEAKRLVNARYLCNTKGQCDGDASVHDDRSATETIETTEDASPGGETETTEVTEDTPPNDDPGAGATSATSTETDTSRTDDESKRIGKNRCGTTYIKVETNGSQKIRECYGTSEDRAHKVVEELTKCIAQHTARPKTTEAVARVYATLLPRITTAICTDERSEKTRSPQNTSHMAVLSERPLVAYPLFFDGVSEEALRSCKSQLDDAIGLIGGLNGSSSYRQTATSASMEDANTCAWKGAAICWTNASSPTSFTCKGKGEVDVQSSGGGGATASPTASTTSRTRTNGQQQNCQGMSCFIQGLLKDKKIQKAVNQLFSRLLSGGNNRNEGSCPSGYKQTGYSRDGKVQCARVSEKSKPRCAIATDKQTMNAGEKIVLKWKTANTDTVSITGIGNSVATSGERELHPASTTTYTLTAKGEGGEKTCQTTVTVKNDQQEDKTTGSFPPLVACTPENIQANDTAQVAWSCPSPADGSFGEGITTQGLTRGTVTVSPEKSAEYRVTCTQDGNNIGSNMCVITVGEPQYDLVAYPATAKAGDRVRISWGSLFMDRCRVQGPRGFDYSHTEGSVVTEPFGVQATTTRAEYTLSCDTNYGTSVVKSVVVERHEEEEN